MRHDGSAYLSTRRAIEAARQDGREEMQELLTEYFERTGRPELAEEVKALRIVEGNGETADNGKGT